jgi:hypothetical protein
MSRSAHHGSCCFRARSHALEVGDDDAMARHGELMGRLLAKVGQITKELTPAGAHTLIQQNFVASPDYHSFQQRALAVLWRHPEALADWLKALAAKRSCRTGTSRG